MHARLRLRQRGASLPGWTVVDRQTVAWGCLPQRAAKDKELSEEAHTSTPTRVRLFGNHQMKVILAVSCIRPGLLVSGPQAKRMTNPNRRQNNRINLPASGWRTLRSEDRFKMCASKPEATPPKSKRDRGMASRIRPLTIGSMTLFQQKLLSGPGLLVLPRLDAERGGCIEANKLCSSS